MLPFLVVTFFNTLALAAICVIDFLVKGSKESRYIYTDIKQSLIVIIAASFLLRILNYDFAKLAAFLIALIPPLFFSAIVAIMVYAFLRRKTQRDFSDLSQ